MNCVSVRVCPVVYSNIWTKEEIESLYWFYEQSRNGNDPIGAIIQLYASNDQRSKTRIAVIQQLLLQDIITLTEYDDHMAAEDVTTGTSKGPVAAQLSPKSMHTYTDYTHGSSDETNNSSDQSGVSSDANDVVADDVQVLKQRIISDNKGKSLMWVQKTLLDCCYVKLQLQRQQCGSDAPNNWTELRDSMEPIPLHYSCMFRFICTFSELANN